MIPPGSNAPVGRGTFRTSDLVSVSEPDYGRLLKEHTGGVLNWQQFKQVLHGKPVNVGVGATVRATQTEEPTQNIFDNPKVTQRIDDVTKHKVTIYSLENGTEVHIFNNSTLSYADVAEHMKRLPKIMQEEKAIIKIKDVSSLKVSGEHWVAKTPIVTVFENGMTKKERLNVLNHELAHNIDVLLLNGKKTLRLSSIENYEKIIKEDNKLYAYTRPNGKKRTPWKFVTDYAGKSWLKFKKNKHTKFQKYVEDFAESVKLYLDDTTRAEFVEQYPNRAKYLKEVLNDKY